MLAPERAAAAQCAPPTSSTSAATSSPSPPCARSASSATRGRACGEIASNSEFSHGVVHYYFDDKLELIIYCVRYYKARCVTRYDAVVADVDDRRRAARRRSPAKLAETIRDEAPMHRLWYDLRTQSMFEEQLRDAVTDDRPDARGDDLAGRQPLRRAGRAAPPAPSPPAAYGMLDGLFQQALLGYVSGHAAVLAALAGQVRADAAHARTLRSRAQPVTTTWKVASVGSAAAPTARRRRGPRAKRPGPVR